MDSRDQASAQTVAPYTGCGLAVLNRCASGVLRGRVPSSGWSHDCGTAGLISAIHATDCHPFPRPRVPWSYEFSAGLTTLFAPRGAGHDGPLINRPRICGAWVDMADQAFGQDRRQDGRGRLYVTAQVQERRVGTAMYLSWVRRRGVRVLVGRSAE